MRASRTSVIVLVRCSSSPRVVPRCFGPSKRDCFELFVVLWNVQCKELQGFPCKKLWHLAAGGNLQQNRRATEHLTSSRTHMQCQRGGVDRAVISVLILSCRAFCSLILLLLVVCRQQPLSRLSCYKALRVCWCIPMHARVDVDESCSRGNCTRAENAQGLFFFVWMSVYMWMSKDKTASFPNQMIGYRLLTFATDFLRFHYCKFNCILVMIKKVVCEDEWMRFYLLFQMIA